MRCWGRNSTGQLGDGTTTNRSSPVSVAGVTNAVAIAAGLFHTCALGPGGVAIGHLPASKRSTSSWVMRVDGLSSATLSQLMTGRV